MGAVKLFDNIFWVGAVDWNIRNFHGQTYTTKKGTTYNAYLILDEKITLIDTVYGPFTEELIENINEIVPVQKIDYIIANHVEVDHSQALPKLLKLSPKAKVFGTEKCKEGLFRYFYIDMNFSVVKTSDTLNLGKYTLKFIEAPMIHWPDSMFTYCNEAKILFSNDAFGQHYASCFRFDDEVEKEELMKEAKKYYANILWPLSPIILRKLEELAKSNLKIDIIAPSHGVIWRKEPNLIIDSYFSWAKNQTKKKIIVVYETMWGSTEKIAKAIVRGIISEGIEVKLYDVTKVDKTEIISDMLDAKGFIFGSSTHNNDMLPTIAGFLEFLKGLKPKNRIAAVFGSYGWVAAAIEEIEKILKNSGIELVMPSLAVKYSPSVEELKMCFEFGKNFAKKL